MIASLPLNARAMPLNSYFSRLLAVLFGFDCRSNVALMDCGVMSNRRSIQCAKSAG